MNPSTRLLLICKVEGKVFLFNGVNTPWRAFTKETSFIYQGFDTTNKNNYIVINYEKYHMRRNAAA
ncbi:MAG: hypothetical protein ACI9E1_000386 [Cryomorphaceae bacterium]|jgi:hypothetical protein